MKNILLTLVILFSALSHIQSQNTPQSFKYQVVVRDTGGTLLTNQSIGIRASIVSDSANGAIVYQESHTASTNQFGLINIEIGSGAPVSGVFNTIDWGAGPHFIKIEMDKTGGTNYLPLSTAQMLSVPYSLYAENVANKDDADADSTNELQTLSIVDSDLTISNGNTVSLAAVANNDEVPDPLIPVPVQFQGSILYVHPSDNSTSIAWSSSLAATAASSVTDGKSNTTAIVSTFGPGSYAAYLCDTLTAFGFTDWYLPAKYELDAINRQSYLIQGLELNSQWKYWSSTETVSPEAWAQRFDYGGPEPDSRIEGMHRCRCVRKD